MTTSNKNSFSLIPKEVALKIPFINEQRDINLDPIVYAHLFGVIGDWYICEISEDRSTGFGYRNINSEKEWEMEEFIPNGKLWGNFSLIYLQKLVNNEFLKDKDIRFLIVRDVEWEPITFSKLNVDRTTLQYPGTKN